jgi:hypothetical protein
MDKKPKDRHLDVPSEANRDKHINFIAEERSESDPAEESNGPLNKKANEQEKKASNRNKKDRNQ